jgi:hypothetical protein
MKAPGSLIGIRALLDELHQRCADGLVLKVIRLPDFGLSTDRGRKFSRRVLFGLRLLFGCLLQF